MASIDELWVTDFGDPFPGEAAYHRPALVIGPSSVVGPNHPYAVVVPLTTSRRGLDLHVEIEAAETSGLDATSYAQCELLRSVSTRRLVHQLGRVDPGTAAHVDDIVRMYLGH